MIFNTLSLLHPPYVCYPPYLYEILMTGLRTDHHFMSSKSQAFKAALVIPRLTLSFETLLLIEKCQIVKVLHDTILCSSYPMALAGNRARTVLPLLYSLKGRRFLAGWECWKPG